MKIECMNFRVDDNEEFEEYLNQKSKEGYELVKFSDVFVHFKKSNQVKTYYVDYRENFKLNDYYLVDEKLKEKNEFYANEGYHFVTSYRYFVVYSSLEKLEKIHTDDEVKEEILKKVIKQNIKYGIYLPILLYCLWFVLLISDSSAVLTIFASNYLMILLGICGILLVGTIGYEIIQISRNKREINEELKWIHRRSIITILSCLSMFITLLVMFWVCERNITSMILFVCSIIILILLKCLYVRFASQESSKRKYLNFAIIFFILFLLNFFIIYSYPTTHEPTNYQESIFLKIKEEDIEKEDESWYRYQYFECNYSFVKSHVLKSLPSLTEFELIDEYKGFKVYKKIYGVDKNELATHHGDPYDKVLITDENHVLMISSNGKIYDMTHDIIDKIKSK